MNKIICSNKNIENYLNKPKMMKIIFKFNNSFWEVYYYKNNILRKINQV